MLSRLRTRLLEPVDLASLALFRVLFGGLMMVSALRFMENGWVEGFFGERTFFFRYYGFSWVAPGPVWAMYALYGALAVLGACIALGFFYRLAMPLFFVLFSYAELTDVTNYLNHYYLVSLLSLLMSFMPLSSAWSLDARAGRVAKSERVPAWMLYLLRFQIGVVYVGAALAKANSDWLLHGQPLNIWLSSRTDAPWIGPYLGLPSVALLASWAGFLHDLTIVPLLMWKRTRVFAYAALLGFHLLTSSWFNIGIFPLLMPLAASLFFAPSWPRRWLGSARSAQDSKVASAPLSQLGWVALAAYCLVQVALPLRVHAYGGNVSWHEQGMRFSWRVMLRAKAGSIRYRVRLPDGRELFVPPRRYLSADQEREMSGQPDLIWQLAQHIARDFAARGQPGVEVRVDALVSLNGRAPAYLIDPSVDLTRVSDDLSFASWITSPPREAPPVLVPSEHYAGLAP
jgi:vitamin K-dependent gamma-carboxylase